MIIKATLQEMADSEIAAMVDPARLKDIKAIDPHPLIKAFVIGYEGESRGNIVGIGNVVKRWFKTMIHKLHEHVAAGVKLFSGHNPTTNEHEGRMSLGEVVGKKFMDIDGRESVAVACYIKPEFRHLPLDVASVETEIAVTTPDEFGKVDIVDIGPVTAIALGNSAVDKPGFPGATLIGQLQAFEQECAIKYGYNTGLRLGYGKTDKTIRLAKPEEDN